MLVGRLFCSGPGLQILQSSLLSTSRGTGASAARRNGRRATLHALPRPHQEPQDHGADRRGDQWHGHVLGVSQSAKGGVGLDTMVQRLVQTTVWEIDNKYK